MIDVDLRNRTYAEFVRLGRAPAPEELGTRDEVLAGWRRLHDAHALVLDGDDRLLMANPFSAVETPHRVEAGERTWYANCGWDAFGIGVVLRADSIIHTTCADCGEAIDLEVRDYRPTDPRPLFHVLVPAADWWSDIGYT